MVSNVADVTATDIVDLRRLLNTTADWRGGYPIDDRLPESLAKVHARKFHAVDRTISQLLSAKITTLKAHLRIAIRRSHNPPNGENEVRHRHFDARTTPGGFQVPSPGGRTEGGSVFGQ